MPRPFCIAGGHTLQARHEEAEALLRPTLPPLRAIYGEHPTVASVLERLGNSLIALGRRDERLGYLRESLAIRVKVLGERHSDVQRARVFLGRALSDAGQYVEAESLFVAALRARTEVFGPQHGAVASSTDDLGALAFTRGDYPEAVRRYRAAIAVWQAARLPQWEMSSQSSLGEALMYADSLGESERVLREALTHQRTIHGADHAEVLLTADRLASTLRRRGGASLAEADSLFRTTLAIRRRLFGSTSSQLNPSLEGLARVREQLGDTTGAEPLIRELVANTATFHPVNDSTSVARKVWLGATLCANGKSTEGERIARELLAAPGVDDATAKRARRILDRCASNSSGRDAPQ